MRFSQSARTTTIWTLVCGVGLCLAACGDDDGGSDTNSNSTSNGTSSTSNGTMTSNGTGTSNMTSSTSNDTSNATTGMTTGGTTDMTTGGTTPNDVLTEGADFGDCFANCPNSTNFGQIDVMSPDYSAVMGTIDDGEHIYNGMMGSDIDIYEVLAPARTLVKMTLSKPEGSSIDPLLLSHDGVKPITLGYDYNNMTDAQTEFLFPYVTEGLPMHIVVYDAVNYDAGLEGPFVGGSDYTYRLSWTTSPFEPEELGELNVGDTVELDTATLEFGEMAVYRFTAAGNVTPEVRLSAAAGSTDEFYPLLLPLNTAGGQVEYGTVDCDSRRPTQTIDWSNTPIENNEHVFVVIDCFGYGGSETAYDIEVSGM
ncbi:MAG: hypothetical protein AAFX99_11180 [Myxococcota bacterium]